MPALSKKQQKFMGIVRSIQKGEQPASKFSKDAQDVAKDMKKKDVKKFASTKHKGLPMKKEVLKKLKEMIRQELSEYTYGSGDIVKDVNPTCPHYGAMGKVKSVGPRSVVFVVMNKGKNFKPGMELEKSHDQMKKMNESVNEMSAKTKKIISKLGKKEKEMFMDMVDMLGFDQVMADYKKDKKAFKQALKDMSESVIKEYVEPNQFNKNFDKAMNMVIKQANNLKGQLAKHPIKRNVNKLKAIQKLYGKFIAPVLVKKDRSLDRDFDFTDIKKDLGNGKFKSVLQYNIMNRLSGSSFRGNSFFMLDDKEKKLLDRINGELRKIVNVLDDAQLENINEDGHTDVASSKRKVMIMVDDSNKLLNKLNGMNLEDSLPSWWTDKITLSQKYLAKATDYLLNPVESVNEASVSQVRSTLSRVKKQLMKKWAKKGGYENFGQKELRALKSKFKENPYGSPQERQISKMLDAFDNWAMNYSGDMKESVNEGKGVEKVLKMANDQSFGKLGGRTVDALSAGLFKGVYEKAPQNAKDKINKMNEKQLYVFMTKLWSKFGNQVRIG